MKSFVAILFFVSASAAAPRIQTPNEHPSGRIVGGKVVSIEERPFQCLVMDRNNLHCGGCIISQQTILTAGHCTRLELTRYRVRVGTNNRLSGGFTSDVASILIHPDFVPITLNNDIALMDLVTSLVWSPQVQPAKLAPKNFELDPGEILQASGWGVLRFGGVNYPENLNLVEVPKVSHEMCQNVYGKDAITPSMVCAGGEKGKDACQGDSGGPLTTREGILVGFVSWGYQCAMDGYPGVYAAVSPHADWIKDNTKY